MMPPWRIPWQLWIQRHAGNARGCDGSRLMDGDEVYVVTNPLEKTLRHIDHFPGSRCPHKGWGPVALMSEDDANVFAFEMFAIHRGGKVIQSIIYIQECVDVDQLMSLKFSTLIFSKTLNKRCWGISRDKPHFL